MPAARARASYIVQSEDLARNRASEEEQQP